MKAIRESTMLFFRDYLNITHVSKDSLPKLRDLAKKHHAVLRVGPILNDVTIKVLFISDTYVEKARDKQGFTSAVKAAGLHIEYQH